MYDTLLIYDNIFNLESQIYFFLNARRKCKAKTNSSLSIRNLGEYAANHG